MTNCSSLYRLSLVQSGSRPVKISLRRRRQLLGQMTPSMHSFETTFPWWKLANNTPLKVPRARSLLQTSSMTGNSSLSTISCLHLKMRQVCNWGAIHSHLEYFVWFWQNQNISQLMSCVLNSSLIQLKQMLTPWSSAGCSGCSFLADNLPSSLTHLNSRGTTLVLVSRAPLEKIESFKKRMGWNYDWYSSFGTDFNYDFHVTMDEDVAPVTYNCKYLFGAYFWLEEVLVP